MPGVAWRTSPTRVRLRENLGQFEVPSFERWVACQEFFFGRALFKHAGNFINSNSGSLDARLAAPNFRILDDHLLSVFEEF